MICKRGDFFLCSQYFSMIFLTIEIQISRTMRELYFSFFVDRIRDDTSDRHSYGVYTFGKLTQFQSGNVAYVVAYDVLRCNNTLRSRLTILFASATGFVECKLPLSAEQLQQNA